MVEEKTGGPPGPDLRVIPVPGKVDWFEAPFAVLPIAGPAPSVWFDPTGPEDRVQIHRSHLPLLAARKESLPPETWETAAYPGPRQTFIPPTPNADWRWRPHQLAGIAFAKSRRGSLIAFQQRLGKSPIPLAVHDPKTGPLVITAPLNVKRVWKKWLSLFFPDASIYYCTGKNYADERVLVQQAPIIFCHHEILSNYQGMGGRRIGTFVIDEVHACSNARSLRSQAAMLIASRSERILGLTGTPLWNDPSGLYSVLSSMHPGAWGKWYDFATRYASGYKGDHGFTTGQPSNAEELRLRLTEVMFRKTWDEVAPELPKTQRTVELVPLTKGQYNDIDFEIAKTAAEAKHTIPVARFSTLRRIAAKAKIDRAVEIIRRWSTLGERSVVWTWHKVIAKDVVARLGSIGLPSFLVTGDSLEAQREAIFDSWEQASAPLVISLSIGQVGIDLSAARKALFLELDWTPAVLDQAEMRTFSIARPMEAMYLAIDHPIEKALAVALQKKFDFARLTGVPAADGALEQVTELFGLRGGPDLERLKAALTMDVRGSYRL